MVHWYISKGISEHGKLVDNIDKFARIFAVLLTKTELVSSGSSNESYQRFYEQVRICSTLCFFFLQANRLNEKGILLHRQVYCLAPEAPLIRWMTTGPNVFLAMPDASGLWPCDRAHLKNGLVPYLLGSGTDDKYRVLPSLPVSTLAIRLTFNTFLPMLYYTFVNILCST